MGRPEPVSVRGELHAEQTHAASLLTWQSGPTYRSLRRPLLLLGRNADRLEQRPASP